MVTYCVLVDDIDIVLETLDLFLGRGLEGGHFFLPLREPGVLELSVLCLVVVDDHDVGVILQRPEEEHQVVVVSVDEVVAFGRVIHDGDEGVEQCRVVLHVFKGVGLALEAPGLADTDRVTDALFALLQQLLAGDEFPVLVPQGDERLHRVLVGVGRQVGVELIADGGQELVGGVALLLLLSVDAQRDRRVDDGAEGLMSLHLCGDERRELLLERFVRHVRDRAVGHIPELPRHREVALQDKTGEDTLARFVEAGNVTGAGTDFFRIGPLKMLGDGALGSRTAHLTVPYLDDSGNRGFSLFTAEEMNRMVSYANAHNLQIAIHAIGDACLDQVLDAIELELREHPRPDHRHGVVHCQVSRADQLERIRRLNLHVYAQSIFLDYDNHIVTKLLPPELAGTSYSWKTLLSGGVCVSNGSDCPVELPDVMEGIECAVTRRSLDGTGPYLPDEAFTVQEALDSFTIAGAHASFEEHCKGLIRKGYLADFVVLGGNPFETDPRKLHEIPVLATVVGGCTVYTDGTLSV